MECRTAGLQATDSQARDLSLSVSLSSVSESFPASPAAAGDVWMKEAETGSLSNLASWPLAALAARH